MNSKIDDTLFETFNAKFLTLEQVGTTFIPHEEFLKLTENKHSIILGPRGSGKTTLLKMLTIPALNSWETKKPKYLSIKKGLAFVSVYIPADLIWEKEIKIIEQKLIKYPNFSVKVINAIFTTNLLISFVKTLKHLVVFDSSQNGRDKEIQLVQSAIKEWYLPEVTFPNLTGIIKELQSRVNSISSLISEIEDINMEEDLVAKPAYFNLNYLKCLPPICTTYDILYNDGNETKWALCFDELEIVPIKIVISLFQELRNAPGQFLFKLSTCPIQSIGDENLYGANQMDELNVIKMWPSNVPNSNVIENNYTEDEDIYRSNYQTFCSELATARFNRLLKKKYDIKIKVSLDNLLGKFDYLKIFKSYVSAINGKKFGEQINYSEKDDFQVGGLGWLAFRELAFIDIRFRNFLNKQKIDPLNPSPKNEIQRTQVHRKFKQIVLNRLMFTKLNKAGNRKNKDLFGYKARRKVLLYHGVKTLVNIVDGNPRYLCGIVDELIDSINVRNIEEGKQVIEITKQSEVTIKIAEKFLNKLKAIPINQNENIIFESPYHNKHLLDLVDVIGKVLQRQINIDPLDNEPHGSINIDPISMKDKHLMELIKIGINWGAFIIVSKDEKERYDNLLGTRIRLAYLLAPYYKLPLRVYQPMSLNQCLTYNNTKWSNQISLKLDNDEDL